MKRLTVAATMLFVVALFCLGGVTTAHAVLKTPPIQLIVNPPALPTEDATYNFQIILDSYAIVRGVPQIRVVINITRSPQGQLTSSRDVVTFNSIILVVIQDASSARIKADGKEFVIEASYPDPFDKNAEPRPVATTFAEMFTGGKVGLTVRVAN
jgi:hypothetical protein